MIYDLIISSSWLAIIVLNLMIYSFFMVSNQDDNDIQVRSTLFCFLDKLSHFFGLIVRSKEENDPFKRTFNLTPENLIYIEVWNVFNRINCSFKSVGSLILHFCLLKSIIFLIYLLHSFLDVYLNLIIIIFQVFIFNILI